MGLYLTSDMVTSSRHAHGAEGHGKEQQKMKDDAGDSKYGQNGKSGVSNSSSNGNLKSNNSVSDQVS